MGYLKTMKTMQEQVENIKTDTSITIRRNRMIITVEYGISTKKIQELDYLFNEKGWIDCTNGQITITYPLGE